MIYLILFTFSFGTILHVDGNNYLTIQSAIDDSQEGDTVLVYNGIYFENLDIDKTITLASLAIYDDLDLWYNYDYVSEQYEISNFNILNTIIDGSQPVDNDFQSGIVVRSTEDDCISPVIMGLTIRNSMGTMVTEEIPHTAIRMIGGGLFSYITNVNIHHNQFANNGTLSLQNGGAVYFQTSVDDWDFDNRSSGIPNCEINEINLHDNFYRDNDAIYGNTFSNRTYTEEINLTNSLFDIYNCSEQNVTNVWVNLHPECVADYTGVQGDICAIMSDVWVSPMGSDFNGLATENSPVKTIKYALEIIAPTESNPINIHFDEGTYSPSSNGETFPIRMISNVNFNGQGEELTSLNAENSARVIIMENCNNNIISNLIIEGGIPPGIFSDNSGGGITAISSNPIISNVTFSGNNAISGAGLNLYESNATLNNVIISGNIAHLSGGGISIISSSPTFNNVTITDNITTVGRGGGMYIDNSNPILNQVTVSGNTAVDWGGGIVLYNSNPILSNMSISNNTTGLNGGGIGIINSNPILTNITISNNVSDFNGGGMGIDNSNPILNNLTISGNTSTNGGGIYLYESNPILTNSIIWDNFPQSIDLDSGEPIVSFSDIEEGWEGEGNIDQDPLFVDSENGNLSLQPNSSCIDAGTPFFELDGEIIVDLNESEYIGSAPDMGAHEYNSLSTGNLIEILPIKYLLENPYPNPFNPVTNIKYSIPENTDVSIRIYGINGNMIEELYNGNQVVGTYNLSWDADNQPSGLYFVKMETNSFTQTQKLMLVK